MLIKKTSSFSLGGIPIPPCGYFHGWPAHQPESHYSCFTREFSEKVKWYRWITKSEILALSKGLKFVQMVIFLIDWYLVGSSIHPFAVCFCVQEKSNLILKATTDHFGKTFML